MIVILLIIVIVILLFGATRIKNAILQFILIAAVFFTGCFIFDALKTVPLFIWLSTGAVLALIVILWLVQVSKTGKNTDLETQRFYDDYLTKRHEQLPPKVGRKFEDESDV